MSGGELLIDLHIHSHHSRATSKDCTLEGLYRWGKIKGIHGIGTGDFTHPLWMAELKEKLVAEPGGLYRLRQGIAAGIDAELPQTVRNEPLYFIPTVEIATIYRKGPRVRKLHQLVVMPTVAAAEALNAQLCTVGNLRADGRPILGMDSKDLFALTLQLEPRSLYIPAHIWTPWFGMFGSKSGFDSLQEAYEELAPQICAIETGLSSDPAMNARIADLDGVTITSHSDAHSPGKLGREATVVQALPTYDDIIGALKTNDQRMVGTVEFFPEEGKYHEDGHRACGIHFTPAQTRAHAGICPVCHRPLTVGVQYRVDELAARATGPLQKTTEYIIPLTEILAELRGVKSAAGKAVLADYHALIAAFGSEFSVLRHIPIEALGSYDSRLGQAIQRMRNGQVVRTAGYDGVYGTSKVFDTPTTAVSLL